MQNFRRDLLIGKKAENTFANYLIKSKVSELIVVMDGMWKWFDIFDFTNNITYEVKNDSWTKETGNICIELWSHKKLQHPGWIKYTTADYLIYFISDDEYLKIPMQTIKDYINIPENLKGKRKVNGWSKGNTNVENILIPYILFTNEILKV